MSYAKLRGRIRENFGTQDKFAEAIGMNKSTLSQKLNAKVEWSRLEVEKACQLLDIDMSEIGAYFFTEKVGKPQ